MRIFLKRARGAIGTGLTWAVAWTVVGLLGVMLADGLGVNTDVVDIWIPVFAYPGFLGGVAFSTVLGIAGRRRGFEEMSLPRFAAWGALGGGLLSACIMVAAGFAPWSWVVGAIWTSSCAASAAGALALARRGDDRVPPLDAGVGREAAGLVSGERRHRIAGHRWSA